MPDFLLLQSGDYLLLEDGNGGGRLILNDGAAAPEGGTLEGEVFEFPSLSGTLFEGAGGIDVSVHREFWLMDEDNTLEIRGIADPAGNLINTGVVNAVLRQGTKQNPGTPIANVTLTPLGSGGNFRGVLDKNQPSPAFVFGQTYTMFYTMSVTGFDGAWSSQKKADFRGRK